MQANKDDLVIDEIMKSVCHAHGETPLRMRGRCRDRKIIAARRDLIKEMKARKYSLPAIGRVIGRDHTVVLYHCQLMGIQNEIAA